jgi:hypothetical protein
MYNPFRLEAGALLLGLALLFAGCGGDDASSSAASARSTYNGTFSGTIGERSYEVPVQCSDLGTDYFEFNSDRTDASDSNGDGYVISGMQNGSKLILTVIDQDTTWSTPNLAEWSVDDATITGSGTVQEDGGAMRSKTAAFTVSCE